MRRTQSLAFTLVELLVVIAIIVALLAILLPSMDRAMSVAQAAVCLSQQKQIGIGFRAYQADFHGLSHNSPNHGRWKATTGDPLVNPATPWLSSSDPYAYWGIAYGPYVQWNLPLFNCPTTGLLDDWWENDQPRYKYSSYGMNVRVKNRNLTAVPNHSTFIIFEDAAEQLMDVGGDVLTITGSDPYNLYQWKVNFGASMPGRVVEWYRHRGQANLLWYDLHGSTLGESTGEDVPLTWYTGT